MLALASLASSLVLTHLVTAAPLERRQNKPGLQWVGVNIAGAEFAPEMIPGTLGENYFFDTVAENSQYQKFGINTYRLPFSWERMQPTLNGPLDPAYLDGYTKMVKDFLTVGNTVIIDMHNYGRYIVDHNTQQKLVVGLQGSGVTSANLSDAWIKIAQAFAWCDKCILGMMNEPNNQDVTDEATYSALWAGVAKDVTTALRNAGEQRPVVVTSIWSNVDTFNGVSGKPLMDAMKGQQNILYEFHSYWNNIWDPRNNTNECTSSQPVIQSFTTLTNTLRQNGAKAFVGEFSSNRHASCDAVAKDLVKFLATNNDVWMGAVAWGGGKHYAPWIGSPAATGDGISLQPDANGNYGALLSEIMLGVATDPAGFVSGTPSTPSSTTTMSKTTTMTTTTTANAFASSSTSSSSTTTCSDHSSSTTSKSSTTTPTPTPNPVPQLNFGGCGMPEVKFAAGIDGQPQTCFAPVDETNFSHGPTNDIQTLGVYICQQLGTTCQADANTVQMCWDALTAANEAMPVGSGAQADMFNSMLGMKTDYSSVPMVNANGELVSNA